VKKLAKNLDDAIEKGALDHILPFFSDNCKIELFGIVLQGKQGLSKALRWMNDHIINIKFTPVVIMIDGSVFFEEFILDANTAQGNKIQIKQTEVLEYDKKYKVVSLRLYFDRLTLAQASADNIFEKWLVDRLVVSSLKELTR